MEKLKMSDNKWVETSVMLMCFALALIVRTYRISDIPYGMHIDEAGMGYDAWCLQKYHVDRWLNSFPVYLINFGGGQSALYTYLCAAFIKLFGKGEWSIIWMRMPGVLLNLAGYMAGVHLIGKIMGKRWKIFSAFILAVLPYFIMQCRFGLDCNLLVNMLTISLCLFCLALEYRKTWLFLLTGLFYGVTYYAYVLSYIPNTLLLVLITVYLLWKDKGLFGKLLCVWIPAGIIAFPLMLMIVVNQFDLPQIEIGMMTIPRIPGYRGSEFEFQLPVILRNSGIVLSSILTRDWIDHNAFDQYYTMYKVSIPFIVLGWCNYAGNIIKNLKDRNAGIDYGIFLWVVFVLYFVFGCCLGGNAVNINKMNAIFFAQFFFLIWGIHTVYGWVAEKYIKSAKILAGLLVMVYLYDFASFAQYYFQEYTTDIYPQFNFSDTYGDILEYLHENHLEEKQTYVYDISNAYIYYMLSAGCDPYEVNLPERWPDCIGNFCFVFPEQIETDAVYIIRETDMEQIQIMRQNDIPLQYEKGMYQCYYKN